MVSPHFTHAASTLRTLLAFAVASLNIIFILDEPKRYQNQSKYQEKKQKSDSFLAFITNLSKIK